MPDTREEDSRRNWLTADLGAVRAVERHQLVGQPETHEVSFSSMLMFGEQLGRFASEVTPKSTLHGEHSLTDPTKNEPEILRRHLKSGNRGFMCLVRYGRGPKDTYPALASVVNTPEGATLELQIVTLSLYTLSEITAKSRQQGLVTMAAALAAPHVFSALNSSVNDSMTCRHPVTSLTPDHALSLAMLTDGPRNNTLTAAEQGQSGVLTLGQTHHYHGKPQTIAKPVMSAVGESGVAAGVTVRTLRLNPSKKRRYNIDYASRPNPVDSLPEIVPLHELFAGGGGGESLALLGVALAFGSKVVQTGREDAAVEILDPNNMDKPIQSLLP